MPTHVNTQIAAARHLARHATKTVTSKAGAIRLMKERGWRQIGKGAFSVAFAHDEHPSVVIKVSANPTENSRRIMADGFPEYANAILRDWIRSSLAPRIYFSERVDRCDRVTITAMERCYRCTNKDFVSRAERTATNLNNPRGRIYSHYCLGGHARRLLECLKQYGDLDIHSGNIMQRLNGSLVLTDPLIIQ